MVFRILWWGRRQRRRHRDFLINFEQAKIFRSISIRFKSDCWWVRFVTRTKLPTTEYHFSSSVRSVRSEHVDHPRLTTDYPLHTRSVFLIAQEMAVASPIIPSKLIFPSKPSVAPLYRTQFLPSFIPLRTSQRLSLRTKLPRRRHL